MFLVVHLFSTNISSNHFRLRLELNRSNEKIEEYRQYFQLIDGQNEQTNIDDLTAIDYSDEDFPPIEKNFCLDDHSNEKNFLFLYSQPCLPPDDDDDDDDDEEDFSTISNLDHQIE